MQSTDDTARRAVAYALHHFFGAAWYNNDERILEVGEADKFTTRATQPVRAAANFLMDGGSAERAIEIIVDLSRAHDELLPHLAA
jgi:hypothetical protein